MPKLSQKKGQAFSMLGLVVFCALLMFAALRVKAANDSWVALGAVAAILQAVGVLLAVGYANKQLKAYKRGDELRRLDTFLDRADEILHEQIKPAYHRMTSAWGSFVFWQVDLPGRVAQGEFKPGDPQEFAVKTQQETDEARDALKIASDELEAAVGRLYRAMSSAGHGRNAEVIMLRIGAIGYSLRLPLRGHAVDEKYLTDNDEGIDDSIRAVEKLITNLLEQRAPSPAAS